MQHPEELTEKQRYRQEDIALLSFQCEQSHKLALYSYRRVRKAAIYTAIFVFILMSGLTHGLLITNNIGAMTHVMALIVNITLTFILYRLINEFHPSRATANRHLHCAEELERKIKQLTQEAHD